MRNKKPPNFSTYFEPETTEQITALQKIKPFLTSKKAVISYCVSIVHALEATLSEDLKNANQ